LNLVGLAAVLLYGLALYAAHHSYPHFWTSRAMSAEEPWYFVGQVFVEALFTAAALLLIITLGLLTQGKLGKEVWSRLLPTFFFLLPSVGQGVNVLLHTERIWDESTASTQWKTFEQYLASNSIAGFLTLLVVSALFLSQLRRLKSFYSDASEPLLPRPASDESE
jgi:hypothetical protein